MKTPRKTEDGLSALGVMACSACPESYVIPEVIYDTSESQRFTLKLCPDCWAKLQREYHMEIGSRDSSPNK